MATDVVSVNPARPAEIVATFPAASEADVDAAVVRAAAAQPAWSEMPIPTMSTSSPSRERIEVRVAMLSRQSSFERSPLERG